MQGIYGFYNKVEKEWWYVGQSIDIERRIKAHRSASYKNEWHTYFREHPDEFDCVELEWVALRQNLLAREAYYIKKLNPKYTTIEANIGSQVGPLSEEMKSKISSNNGAKRPEVRAKISATLTGHPVSDETKAKLSATHTGEKSFNWGTKWMHKTNEEPILVKPCDIETKRTEGYILGRK